MVFHAMTVMQNDTCVIHLLGFIALVSDTRQNIDYLTLILLKIGGKLDFDVHKKRPPC